MEQQKLKQQLMYEKDPAKFSALIQSLTQPLNSGLTSSVKRYVDANVAGAGGGDTPQWQTEALAQGLGPYAQNNQNSAMQAALQMIFGSGGASPNYPTSNLSGNFAQLAKMYPGGGSGTSTSSPGLQPGIDFGDS
jgi:hypothetical protein